MCSTLRVHDGITRIFVKFALCPGSLCGSARILCQFQGSEGASELKIHLRAAERKLLQCRRRHRRGVVRAQLRLWFLELPDSPLGGDSGNSEMSDSHRKRRLSLL